MIALTVIGILLAVIAIILFLPVSINLKFEEDFFVKVKFAFIKIYETKPQKKKYKANKKRADKDKETEKPSENEIGAKGKEIFAILKSKYGFVGAVRTVLGLFGDMLAHIKSFLRHIKVKRVLLNITISGDNAAETAINYGKVCAAAYPVTSFLQNCSEIGFKQINIRSDFSGGKSEFGAALNIRMQVFFILIVAYRVYTEYKKFLVKENLNERE